MRAFIHSREAYPIALFLLFVMAWVLLGSGEIALSEASQAQYPSQQVAALNVNDR